MVLAGRATALAIRGRRDHTVVLSQLSPLSATPCPRRRSLSGPSRKERTVQQVVLCDVPALFSRFSRASLPASVAAAPFPSNDHRANHPFPPPFSIQHPAASRSIPHGHCHCHSHSRPLLTTHSSVQGTRSCFVCSDPQAPAPTHLTDLTHRTTVHVWCLTIFSPHATIMHTHCQV